MFPTRYLFLLSLVASNAACSPSGSTALVAPDADAGVQSDSMVSTDAQNLPDANQTDASATTSSGCLFLERCLGAQFSMLFASQADCVSQVGESIDATLTGVSPTEISALKDQLASAPCAAILSGTFTLPAYGSLPAGSACSSNLQCQSGNCQIAGKTYSGVYSATSTQTCTDGTCAVCGTCGGAGAGGTCATTMDCAADFACIQKTCQTRLAIGATCTSSEQCQSGACNKTAGTGNGRCVDMVLDVPVGSACSISADTLHSCQSGSMCSDSTNQLCVTPTPIAAGGNCGDAGTCTPGTYCDNGTSKCTPNIAPGGACDTTTNNPCGYQRQCRSSSDGGTTGTCQTHLVSAPTCP